MLEKVKKALEWCSGNNFCKECEYYKHSAGCLNQLHKDALDVINNLSDDRIKEFSHFLIDSAVDGVVKVDDMPDLVIKYSEVGHE